MAALPTGTITFLFTDVEGSTRLWEAHPAAMRGVMARHDALLTAVFEQHDGIVVRPRGEGDSLFAVFVRASDAVAAALAGQRALGAEAWGEVGPLRVRMGLHTGEADLREGDYYGTAVNRSRLAERGSLGSGFGADRIVVALVDDDVELYDHLLETPQLRECHLVPLRRSTTPNWKRKAALALGAGYSPEAVADASYQDSRVIWGNESAYWSNRGDVFATLEASDDDSLRQVAEAGRRIAEHRHGRALQLERREAIYGME